MSHEMRPKWVVCKKVKKQISQWMEMVDSVPVMGFDDHFEAEMFVSLQSGPHVIEEYSDEKHGKALMPEGGWDEHPCINCGQTAYHRNCYDLHPYDCDCEGCKGKNVDPENLIPE